MYRDPYGEDVHLPQFIDEVVGKNSDKEVGTKNLHKEWREEDFVSDEADKEAAWIGEDEVLIDTNVISATKIKELIWVGMDLDKTFDLIPWPTLR